MMKSITQIPATPDYIPPTPQPQTTPWIESLLLLTALLIHLRQTLETSTNLVEKLDHLIDSLNDLIRTLFRRK
jgi:hypothetical protein